MINIKKLFQDYNVTYSERGNNLSQGWISTDCPFCNSTKGHFAINPYREQANCWRCGGHPLVESLTLLLNISNKEAKGLIFTYKNDATVVVEEVEQVKKPYIPLGKKCTIDHAQYLIDRGFDAEYIINTYKLRGTVTTPAWENRIVIPVFHNGKEVSYQTRTIDPDEELRYKGCSRKKSIMHYKDLLYPEREASIAVVVEGVFDMWRLGYLSVCTFGTTLSMSQIGLLSKYDKVFFAFDITDDGAQEKAKKYCRSLRMLGCDASRLEVGAETDPGDFTEQQVKEFWQQVEKII